MRIEVTLPYDGIERGVYDTNDKALKGLVEYLVKAGHARIIGFDGIVNEAPATELLPSDPVELVVDAFDREYYLELYEDIYEKTAPSNISDDTLRQRVENPPSDTQHIDD